MSTLLTTLESRLERRARLLPAPLKATVKASRHAIDPPLRLLYRRGADRKLSIPPSSIRLRSGAPSIRWYFDGGRDHADSIERALAAVGREIGDFISVLDFAAGAGRILRHIAGRNSNARYVGSDVDARAIGWARKNLPAAEWVVNSFEPPLPFSDSTFDLVYSHSIFTHLDELTQFAWLDEIRRVSGQGGLAVLSFHGPSAYENSRSGHAVSHSRSCSRRVADHGDLEVEGFIFEPYEVTRWDRRDFAGVSGQFGMSFHSHDYIRDKWSRGFKVRAVMPRAIGWQDLVILERT